MKLKLQIFSVIVLIINFKLIAQQTYLQDSVYYNQLNEYQKKYLKIAKLGGFPFIKIPKKQYLINDSSKNIPALKKYLMLTDDLLMNDSSIYCSQTLINAIIHYQQRFGLKTNGKIDAATQREMNTSIAVRLTQIEINLQRISVFNIVREEKFIIINIPEYKLYIIENKIPIYAANVVVGKALTQTLVFKDSISSIILNPYWNIPLSIINKDILPKIQHNKNYLAENNMEMLSTDPPVIRQKPGNTNALGKMKFIFPNSHNIYLHDTPIKYLFNNYKRTLSHGCIRLENPKVLAVYLLKNSTEWNITKIDTVLNTDIETPIEVVPKVPICIVYFTAWVSFNGLLNFRKDVYKKDKIFVK